MKILGLDFETTGASPESDRVIEIGAVIWDTDRQQPICLHQRLVRYAAEPTVSDRIRELTGITTDDLRSYGIDPSEAFRELFALMRQCRYIVAHNGFRFDQPLFDNEVRRLALEDEARDARKVWIDTCTDVPYPDDCRTRKLRYLAAEHSFLNPFSHRALFDVLTMLTVLSRYEIAEVAMIAQSPFVAIQAKVSYDDRDKAKSRGYRWDGDGSRWLKWVREKSLGAEMSHGEFEVVRLDAQDVPRKLKE